MLAPHQRQLLLEDLQPPVGYELDAAVATTFTLALPSALIPALAFSTLRLNDETRDPLVILESVKRISDRVDVFCQAGAIFVPQKSNDLFAFLEPMLHQVAPPVGGLFHPKLWFLRYANAEASAVAHRLLVLSRNLTSDATWDVVVRLDATRMAERPLPANQPLADLIARLPQESVHALEATREARVAGLARDAARIEWELPGWAKSISFHTELSGPDIWRAGRTLVISPFTDDGGLTRIRGDRRCYLVARPAQLDALSTEARESLTCFVINPAAGEDPQPTPERVPSESVAPESVPAPPSGLTADLHAKVYVLEAWDGRSRTDRILFGSANATANALTRNRELLVEFTGHRDAIGIDAFLGALVDSKDGSLEGFLDPYAPGSPVEPDPAEEAQRMMENWLRSVAEIPHRVSVERSADGRHSVLLDARKPYPPRPEWQVRVGLLTLRGREHAVDTAMQLSVALDDVETPDLTPYVTVAVCNADGVAASTILVADLRGAPDDRYDQILARQIDTPEKFLRLLHLLLGLVDVGGFVESLDDTSDAAVWGGADSRRGGGGELELILTALATNPRSLRHVDDMVRRLESTPEGQKVLPAGFLALWHEVRCVVAEEAQQ